MKWLCHADTSGVPDRKPGAAIMLRGCVQNVFMTGDRSGHCSPGPIQGDMVHPYSGAGMEKKPLITLLKIWKIFWAGPSAFPVQEQAMKIAIVAAGFTPAEAMN